MYFPEFRQLVSTSERRVYKPSKSGVFEGSIDVVKGLHYGQRKLILSEVEFLSALMETPRSEKPILVVYAGAANGSHLPFLFELFPKVEFILIDPAPFCDAVRRIADKPTGPIAEIIEACCTDELCMRIKRDYCGSHRIVLVSDIRSGVPSRSTNKEHTDMIMRDNKWQQGWYACLGAECAMLKFHPPYPKVMDPASPKFEPTDDTPSTVSYLDGHLLWGVWSPKSSSEVRLVVQGAPKERVYDVIEFEEQCYFYNTTDRFRRDVVAESTILSRYLAVSGSSDDVFSMSKRLSEWLNFEKFLPLAQTEAEARIVSLLYLSKNKTDIELLAAVAAVTPADLCAEVARRCGLSGKCSTFPAVPEWFWSRVAHGKNLGEAYSFPLLPRASQPRSQVAKRPRADDQGL